jgi:hypothetical protein
LFRLWAKVGGRDANILENNIVQTAGSAGESIAFGVGVTMPAIMILGFDLEVTRVMIVGVFGALLGILMMIPLRRALIVQQHGELKYPEGTACAEVLKAGADAESRAASSTTYARPRGQPSGAAIFGGFGVGLIYKVRHVGLQSLWKDTPEKVFGAPLAGGSIAAEISPELAGCRLHHRAAHFLHHGRGRRALLFGIDSVDQILWRERVQGRRAGTCARSSDMSPNAIRSEYILYIGAGAVAAGGHHQPGAFMPLIWHGIRAGLADFGAGAA